MWQPIEPKPKLPRFMRRAIVRWARESARRPEEHWQRYWRHAEAEEMRRRKSLGITGAGT
jgi:hypothetical protein